VRAALTLLLVALLLPAGGTSRERRVAIFYYPWYGNPRHDGGWIQWQQGGARPPRTIGSRFYPARGAYSSGDVRVVRSQLAEIAAAGVDDVVVSWWGRGSLVDRRLPLVLRAARRAGLAVAAHLEPYGGRTAATVEHDVAYLRARGIRDVYVFDPFTVEVEDWAAINARLHGVRVFAHTGLVGRARRARFDGIYTYSPLPVRERTFVRICDQARRARLLCAPSVAPGFDARRATSVRERRPRRAGRTYDTMWRQAIRAGADLVTITSYNEWLEGTQVEPARARRGHAGYDGAYGLREREARRAYLAATARWSRRFHAGR
jgi:glycoprotein endo-alpha-1,2-mannosidase